MSWGISYASSDTAAGWLYCGSHMSIENTLDIWHIGWIMLNSMIKFIKCQVNSSEHQHVLGYILCILQHHCCIVLPPINMVCESDLSPTPLANPCGLDEQWIRLISMVQESALGPPHWPACMIWGCNLSGQPVRYGEVTRALSIGRPVWFRVVIYLANPYGWVVDLANQCGTGKCLGPTPLANLYHTDTISIRPFRSTQLQ